MFCIVKGREFEENYEWFEGSWKAEVNVLSLDILQANAAELQRALREHGEQFFIDLCDAVDNKWINGVSYKLGWLHPLGRQLLAWAERDDPRELLASERLPALLPDRPPIRLRK